HQTTLSFANRSEKIKDTGGVLFWGVLKLELFLRIQRSQVVKQDFLSRPLRLFVVNRLNFQKGKIALPFLWRTNLPSDHISSTKTETANLAGRHIDVVRTGQVVVIRRP